jgi:hypothetical protein
MPFTPVEGAWRAATSRQRARKNHLRPAVQMWEKSSVNPNFSGAPETRRLFESPRRQPGAFVFLARIAIRKGEVICR